jgi:hypothetical protein
VDQTDVPPVLAAHLDHSGLGGTDGGVRGAMVDLARNFGRKSSTATAS